MKNDHLGFTIPYVHKGRSHSYIPDFLVRLKPGDDEDVDRTLIVEVSGSQKSPGPTRPEGDHGTRLVVRRGQQPRRLRPLGLHRDDRTRSSSRRASPTRSRRCTATTPIIGDPDRLDFELAGHGA